MKQRIPQGLLSSFVSPNYCWAQGLPLRLVCFPNDTLDLVYLITTCFPVHSVIDVCTFLSSRTPSGIDILDCVLAAAVSVSSYVCQPWCV